MRKWIVRVDQIAREREKEKNEEEVIKTSLIYRTCDYIRQSDYVI